jgi:CheY-like chemotaxis protein
MSLSRVLIVDDSEADQFLCQYVIESLNPSVNVIKAFDGEEALSFIEKSNDNIDLIFLDINMPGMDGFSFLEAYQKIDGSNCAEIIMLTSSTQKEDYEQCMQYKQVKNFFTKPLSSEQLKEHFKLH